ncbi:MAG: hypothetical protein IJD85_03180 [Oscillospiraceae bacterium]|nr:hypothetical protein [Oscillospiraceae bacterium]
MKGKATITLSDAKTGKIIQQMEEHNLVTNALNNIFNPPQYALLHGFNYSNLFQHGLPMWNKLLGGIMLLGNNEEESVDNILPRKGVIPIATAGTEYAGSCPTRGTLNLNESYETDNGYHFTWDFGTDKANGTIRCICLTSKSFGNTGYGTSNYDEGMLMSPNTFDNSSSSTMVFEYGEGFYIGTYDGLHVFMHVTPDFKVELRRYTGLVPTAIKINDRAGLSTVSTPVSVTTAELGIELSYERRYFLNCESKKIYFFSPFVNEDDTSTFTYAEVDITTAQTVNRTVTLDKRVYDYGGNAVFGGRIYILSGEGLNEFSIDGTFIRTVVPMSVSTSLHFFVINGCLFAEAYDCLINITDDCRELTLGYTCYPSGPSPLEPYIPISTQNSHVIGYGTDRCMNKASFVMAAGYKATINNLSSPIEKTSEHTLKISYDISC